MLEFATSSTGARAGRAGQVRRVRDGEQRGRRPAGGRGAAGWHVGPGWVPVRCTGGGCLGAGGGEGFGGRARLWEDRSAVGEWMLVRFRGGDGVPLPLTPLPTACSLLLQGRERDKQQVLEHIKLGSFLFSERNKEQSLAFTQSGVVRRGHASGMAEAKEL